MNTNELFTNAGYELDEIGMFDFEGYTIDIDDVELTENTIENFLTGAKGYAQPGYIEHQTETTLIIAGARPRHGSRRQTVIVFDLGSTRAVTIY